MRPRQSRSQTSLTPEGKTAWLAMLRHRDASGFRALALHGPNGRTERRGRRLRWWPHHLRLHSSRIRVLALKYKYTCLSAIGNISIHRLVVLESSNESIVPAGAAALSSVVDGKSRGSPDTDRAVLFPPPPPPEGPCSLQDRALLDGQPVITFTVTSGSWTVHDGLSSYP